MLVNTRKSNIYHFGIDEYILDAFKRLLPYNFFPLEDGFKYLGYFLKPSSYKNNDWLWLVKRVE